MAKRRNLILGIGCLGLLVGIALIAVIMKAIMVPGLPSEMILALTLDGPIVEVKAEDPFAQLMGDRTVSLRTLRRALVAAADDPRVQGVRVRIDSFGGGIAAAQELRSLLGRVRASGKWTSAYLDTAGEFSSGNLQYYVAAACDEVSLNPMGDINLIGLALYTPFIRGTLDKIGAKPEFPGRGPYKTARFMYTNTEFTESHREMMEWLADSLMEQLVSGVASSRSMEPSEVRNLIDQAPFLGQQALDAGLVDELEDWKSFTDRVLDKTSGRAKVLGPHSYLTRHAKHAYGTKIAVITGVGAIMRGESGQSLNPLLGGDIMGAETIARAWRDARKTRGVKAAVFRIDSPGGSAVASEIVRQEMERTAQEMPVVVSMAGYAASGGYWITGGAQHIVAYPGTLTASIGVFAGHLNLNELYGDKLGITFGAVKRGANANIYGELEDWNDSQRAAVDRMLDRIYDAFLERVAASRGMTTQEVDALGEGRVFTGEQALERGLVDTLGGFDVALDEARRLADLTPDQPVTLVELPKAKPLWQQLIEQSRHEEAAARQLDELVAQWRTSGLLTTPGVVWMPPITVR